LALLLIVISLNQPLSFCHHQWRSQQLISKKGEEGFTQAPLFFEGILQSLHIVEV
jgi:hypothetical protein